MALHDATFLDRLPALPRLGLGISTEHGAGDRPGALDLLALRAGHPHLAGFLEVGLEVERGFDRHTRAWIEAGGRTTLHFLDLNLEDPQDLDPTWLAGFRAAIGQLRPAWICGDAGLWHTGGRERGQMLLLPPILTDESARQMAEGIIALREATGLEVLPENPPGTVFVGDLHLIEFFARLCEYADTGMLLDLAHLAIYQAASGHELMDGLDSLPADRVIECHIAGGVHRETQGWPWIDDDHGTDILPQTWALTDAVLPRAQNLRAIVYECERNPLEACLPGLREINARWQGTVLRPVARRPALPPAPSSPRDPRRIQRAVVSLLHDPTLQDFPTLTEAERALLRHIEPRALRTDPYRRGRVLTALLEEAPTSAALALGGEPAAALDDFFCSERFHRAVAEGERFALAFLDWLQPKAGGLALLEAAIARARRDPPRQAGTLLQRAPGLLPVCLPAGTLARFASLSQQLGTEPLAALAEGLPVTPPPLESGEEWLLVDLRAGLSECGEELARLILAADQPQSEEHLVQLARELGADDAAAEVIADLVADGSLVPAGGALVSR